MKTQVILLLALLCAITIAEQTKFQSKLSSLLNMQAKAVDAVDSALNLLRDLKQANVDSQSASDDLNRTQEQNLGKQLADLTYIADINKAAGDEATTNRKFLQNEIDVTQQNLAWITNRRDEVLKKKDLYREHRCAANMMFIKALKEHDEALEVIRFLREDVVGIVNSAGSEVDFAQIKDSASKLKAYAHLFQQNAMKEFAQLTAEDYVDPETAQWDSKADDNSKNQLSLNRMGAGTDDRDVGQKLLDAIDKLEEHLNKSIADLEKNEIQAAWDLSQWLQDTDAELIQLDQDQATKTTYIDKLLINIVGAKAHEDRTWEIYFESAALVNDAIADLQAKRAWYVQEKARRDEENALLDQIINVFIERVSSLDSGLKTKVNDYSDNKQFDNSDLHRKTDDAYSKDFGRLGQNVDQESRL